MLLSPDLWYVIRGFVWPGTPPDVLIRFSGHTTRCSTPGAQRVSASPRVATLSGARLPANTAPPDTRTALRKFGLGCTGRNVRGHWNASRGRKKAVLPNPPTSKTLKTIFYPRRTTLLAKATKHQKVCKTASPAEFNLETRFSRESYFPKSTNLHRNIFSRTPFFGSSKFQDLDNTLLLALDDACDENSNIRETFNLRRPARFSFGPSFFLIFINE